MSERKTGIDRIGVESDSGVGAWRSDGMMDDDKGYNMTDGKAPGNGVREFKRVVKFVLFSASAGLIEIGSFTLLNELLHLPYWVSYLIALILSVLWNFTFNRRFTFKSTANVPVAMLKVIAYYVVFTPLSTGLEHWYTMGLGWNEYVATIANMLLNVTTEFLYQRFFVFGKTIDSRVAKGESAN